MSPSKPFATAFRTLAVCLLFAVCFVLGGTLSGLAKMVQALPSTNPQPQSPLSFLVFSLLAGTVLSYLILRSSWHGLALISAIFFASFGIATVATQVETAFFLAAKLPRGLMPALFLQGAIAFALFAPLAVLTLRKWKAPSPRATVSQPTSSPTSSSLLWKIPLLVLAFAFLYMFFGYYIAWQNPDLRHYYGGDAFPNFYNALTTNATIRPSLYLLQVFRALLYIACAFPLLLMLRVSRVEKIVAITLFFSVWTTALFIPNPLMPATVALSHFYETLAFNLIFGTLLATLLTNTEPRQLGPSA
jgi:hypothetical protein